MNISNQTILEVNQLQPKLGNAYLKLRLEDEVKSILPLAQIQEVSLIALEQVTFIPGMAKCILGLVHRRNQVIWIVDLPQILGLTPINYSTDQYQVAIANHQKMALGLVVRQIQEVIRLSDTEINLLTGDNNASDGVEANISLSLLPYLNGWVQQLDETLVLLNTQAILNAPILRQK